MLYDIIPVNQYHTHLTPTQCNHRLYYTCHMTQPFMMSIRQSLKLLYCTVLSFTYGFGSPVQCLTFMAMNNRQLAFVGLQESIFSNFIQKLSCIHDILFFAKLISCSNTDNLYMHITVTYINFKRVSCIMHTAPQHQTIVTKIIVPGHRPHLQHLI